MSDQKESSVLFNLKELMNLEEDRIHSEAEAAQKAADAERARIAAEAAARKAAEEARIRAEQEAQAAAERAQREEEERVRREAEEGALRVRLEAEAAARAEEQSRLLAHEQKLATIEAEKKKGVHPGIIVGIILLVVGGGVGAYFGFVKPQLDERDRAAQLASEQAEHERQAREAERTRLPAN